MKAKRKISSLSWLVAAGFLIRSIDVYAQAGTLDPSFGGDGIVTYDFGGIDAAQAIALDDDGNIFVAGYGVVGAGPYKDIAIAKFTSDGALDPVFGGDGTVNTDLGASYDDFAYAIAIQPDGKILVGGSTNNGDAYQMCVLRYRADGSLDPIFGDGGKLIIDFGGPDDAVRSLSVLGDGHIIAGGYRMEEVTATMFKRNFAAVKCTETGVLDNDFSDDGKVATPFSSDRHATGFAMSVQPDGKIVMAGYSYVGTSANYQVALLRYNGDGTLDPTFDGDGMVLVSTGFALGEAYALQIQPDNKIVVAGCVYEGFDTDVAVMRFNSDGSLDNTFGTGGLVQTNWGTGEEERAYAMALQWDGSIAVAGYRGNGSGRQTIVLRYNQDGTPDNSFGIDGKVSNDISAEADGANAILIQPDGKFLVAGYYDNGPDNDFMVLRYLSDPGTSIQIPDEASVTVSPNPVDEILQIEAHENATVAIYSINGACVFTGEIMPGNNLIDVAGYTPGVYTIRIIGTGKNEEVIRVVKH